MLLMCSAGSDKGLVGANQLLSGSSSQRPVCFLGLAVDQSLCVCVCPCVLVSWEAGEWKERDSREAERGDAFFGIRFCFPNSTIKVRLEREEGETEIVWVKQG